MTRTRFRKELGNDTRPLVSVVMPVYNGQEYLVDAIDSILSQSVSNFELLAIDDGSTDSSPRILKDYQNKDPRIRIVSRPNRGLASTLNESIDLARGDWIARMDQDDIALPHRLARQLEWLRDTGADLCGSWVQRFGTSDKRIVRVHSTDSAIKMELLFCSPFAHPSVMMRTEKLRQLRYDSTWEKAEDYDLWVRAAESGWLMTNVQEVLLHYRVHSTQITTSAAKLQHRQGQKIRRRYWHYVFEQRKLNKEWIDEFLKVFSYSVQEVDMDAVDATLSELLRTTEGESRAVVLTHATRIYLKRAGTCPNIVMRWGRLNREFGNKWGMATRLQLFLFRLFRVKEKSFLIGLIRMLYIWGSTLLRKN